MLELGDARSLLVWIVSTILPPILIGLVAWKLLPWLYGVLYGLVFPLDEEICRRTRNGYVYKLGAIWRLYYWIFPMKLMQKRAQRKALAQEREDWVLSGLLLEYERLLQRRQWLEEEIEERARAHSKLSWKLSGLKKRDADGKKKDGEGEMESVNVDGLATYEETKSLGIELENVKFRLFAIKQELKLHDIDKSGDK